MSDGQEASSAPVNEVRTSPDCPPADAKFDLALKLSRVLAETKLGSNATLREELFLGRQVSLWDVVATVMVLYRFPLPFVPDNDGGGWLRRLACRIRPYVGLAARVKETLESNHRKATGCADWPEGNRTVLITCFTKPFYQQVLQPVADALATRLAEVVVVHGGQFAEPPDHAERLAFHSIWDHWDGEVERVQWSIRQRLREIEKRVFDGKQFGVLMDGVRRQMGNINVKGDLRWLFWREFVRLAPHVAVAEHMVLRHRPALIVSADDADQRCRVYSLLAKAVGIPTLLVQQGLSVRHYPEWRFLSHDRVAAMGESSRADMIAQGVDHGRIVVTGHPGFDRFAATDFDDLAGVRNELGVPEHHKLVLFASQPSYIGAFDQPHKRTEMLTAVAGIVGSLKDVTLVIKPHPGERRSDLVSLIGNKPHVTISDEAVNIAPLIKACDVFVTFFSTTALQALYAGKPVITIEIPGSGGGRLYTDSRATWVARSADELMSHITNLLSVQRAELLKAKEEARFRFLRNMAFHPDGKATERVVEVVAELLGPEEAPSSSHKARERIAVV